MKKSKYIAFFDECGDHSLTKIDKDFPIFLLALVVIEREVYEKKIIPQMASLKLKYWDHEGVNLHSRDIRKAKGPFSILQISDVRNSFLKELSTLMSESEYELFFTAIDKRNHLKKWGDRVENPYTLALRNSLLELSMFLDINEEKELPLVAEARGKKEDDELRLAFLELIQEHKDIEWSLIFQSKLNNIAGVQLANLVAHPAARNILNSEQQNRAWDSVKNKMFRKEGIRIFP